MASWKLDEEEVLADRAGEVIGAWNKHLILSRLERKRLIKMGYDPNELAPRKGQLSTEDRDILYSLVRPMIYSFPSKFIFARYFGGDHELIGALDLVGLESGLWLIFNYSLSRYDHTKEAKFTSYLYNAIESWYFRAVLSADTRQHALSKFPVPLLRELDKQVSDLATAGCITEEVLHQKLGSDMAEKFLLLCRFQPVVMQDDIASYDMPELSAKEDMEENRAWKLAEKYLESRSFKILCFRREGETLEQIGHRYRLTKARVGQIEAKALRRLRKLLKKEP